jgi:hypothetical protein
MKATRTTILAGALCLATSMAGAEASHAAAAATTARAPKAPATTPCPAGPTGAITDARVTVTYRAPTRDKGGQDSSLKPGYIFQVVHVTLHNHGKFTYKYNSLDFTLLDPGAHAYEEGTAYDNNLSQAIDTGSLAPGKTISGQIAYIVPAKLTPATISWQPTGLGLDQPGGAKIDTNPRNILLPGYKGGAAQCPAGPTGATTLDGVTVTLGAIKSGGHSSELKQGAVFQELHVIMRDAGKYSYEYNPNDFIALDAGARAYPQVTAYDNNLSQPIDTGTLHKGATVTGDLAFEVPAGVTIVAVRWIPTGLGLQQNASLDISNQIIRLHK